MEGMLTFTGIIIIVFGILQIILFFKIWGMTDDIREIRNKYLNDTANNTSSEEVRESEVCSNSSSVNDKIDNPDFEIDELVVRIKDDKQMRVKEYRDNKYSCYTNNGTVHEGDFDRTEIKKFQYKK